MKKFLLFTLFLSISLNAQVIEKKNYCIKKDTYHYSYKDLNEIYTQYIANYTPDYKRVLSIETKKPTKEGGFFTQFIDSLKYDGEGRLIKSERFENIEGNFTKDNIEIYVYNERGALDTLTSKNWDPDLNKYTNGRRYIHQYDEEGKLVSVKWQAGENYKDTWRELFADRYTYKDGRLYRRERKYDESNGGQFLERTTHFYDNQGRGIRDLTEKYREGTGWFIFSKYEITYNDEGNATSKIEYLFNVREDDWVPNFRWEPVEYDKTHLSKNTYSSISSTTGVFPSKNVLLSYNAYGYDSNERKWKQYTKNNIFYDFDVEVESKVKKTPVEESKKELRLYPNPTTDAFSIDSDETEGTVKVYDLSGKLLKNFMLDDIYDVRFLKPGVYIVIFETKDSKKDFKLIKK